MEFTKIEIRSAIAKLRVDAKYWREHALIDVTDAERKYAAKRYTDTMTRLEELSKMEGEA